MNRSLVAAASVALLLITSSPASAWDPDWDDRSSDRPGDAAWVPEPAPPAPPKGIYLVTETYVDDVVIRSGPVTTYATETVHETTGSYARVLENVPTGARSGYDGTAFNGRAALTDGRSVAGTYYENYIRTDYGYIPVSIVFFQDDLEIARTTRSSAPASQPVSDPAPEPQPATPVPSAPPSGAVTPLVDGADRRRGVLEERSVTVPVGLPARTAPIPLPDRAIEVLRARRIALSFAGPGVAGWRFTSGEGIALGPVSGSAAERFFVRWDHLAPPGQAWVARFLVAYTDGTTRDLAIRVTVRAPGLVE